MTPPLSKIEFLTLSNALCGDCRRWLKVVEAHHALTADELAALSEAIEIIDRTTVKLVAEEPPSTRDRP